MTTKDLGMVTAYAYAVMGGYEGTEAEFEALLGNIATDLEEIENLTVIANTLPEGSSATASYADGVLTLGIPKGDTGATGAGATATVGTTATGNPGTNASVTNSGTAKDAVFNFTIPRGDTGNGIESIYLTGTSGAVKTYTILFTDGNTTTFDVTDGEVTNASLAEVLEDYAKVDGAYEQMTVGNAEQLISSVTVNDKVPYNFRTSGGSIDIGNREVDKLVGGTVAWNQLQANTHNKTANGITFTYSDGALTVSGTASATAWWCSGSNETWDFIKDHIYLMDVGNSSYTSDATGTKPVWYIPDYFGGYGYLYAPTLMRKCVSTGANYFQLQVPSGYSYNSAIVYRPQVFDLTQMFGSTIADYIYSLETATAGAGVAWFKKLFPKDYYPYNAGELMSVKTSAHQMVGFNAWDEEWEQGAISGGMPSASNTAIRSKNYCKCISGASYYGKCSDYNNAYYMRVWWYDVDKNYISGDWICGVTVVAPSNARYFKLSTNTSTYVYGNVYNHDICINLSWDGERDGDYEAYKKWTYPLDSDLELRGIPKLDASNNLYYDGDTYEDDGTVTRKYGIVDLGTLSWEYVTTAGVPMFYAGLSDGAKTDSVPVICSKYPSVETQTTFLSGDKVVRGYGSDVYNFSRVGVRDTAYTDAATFKTAMSGVYLVYELATPTNEEADPYQNPQIVDDFGTEEYVDERTVAIPVGHDTEYMNNLKAKLEMAPDSPDGDGDYIVRQTNGENSYVPLMKELPSAPSEDGTYTLKCTVASGVATLGWEREE